ncbi:MAG: AAA family ATPase, partial [Cytophagales bacterium]|nr:AAA family ATPase [Cytophagales bacterium]
AQLHAQLAAHETALEGEKEALLGKEKLMASRQKSLNESINAIRQYESERRIKNERLRLLDDKVSSLKTQLTADQGQQESAAAHIERIDAEREAARTGLEALRESLAARQEAYAEQKEAAGELQRGINRLNAAHREGQNEVFGLRKTLEIKQVQLSTLKQELEKAASADAAQQASLGMFDENVADLSAQLSEKSGELADLREELAGVQDRLEEVESDAERTSQEVAALGRRLDARQNEYNLTKSLVDNLEGFPEAIQFLRKGGQWPAPAPLVSDILTCPDAYRVALENYLEPVMNYHVVQTEAQAYEAINLLCEAGKGRAHFFVLDKLDAFGATPPAIAPGADTVAAVAVAEFEPQYQNLVAHLLDNVYVLRHNPDPLPVAPGAVFLSQDGRCIGRPFSLSGGSVGHFEGKRIGRAMNLENLRRETGRLETSLAEWQGRQRETRSLREELLTRRNALNVRISQAQKEADVLSRELVTLRARQEQLVLTVQNQSLRREDLLAQLEDLEETLAEVRPEAEAKAVALGRLEAELTGLQGQLETQNEMVSVSSNAYNAENIRFHQAQNRLASLEQELSFQRNTLEKTTERITRNAEELARAEADIAHLTETAETGDDQLADLYREKESVAAGLDEAEKDYYAARGRIDRLEKEARDLHRQRELTDALLLELQTKLNETRLQLSSVKERLSVQFNVDLDELMNEGDGRLEKQLRITNDELREDREGDVPAVGEKVTGPEGAGQAEKGPLEKGPLEKGQAVFDADGQGTFLFGAVAVKKIKGAAKTVADAPPVPEHLTEAEIQEKVRDLKARLDKIGPVNPMALEAYQEIKGRYDFINGQKNDLFNAKQSLLSTIAEIDAVARETFMNAFNQIRQNFIKVFRSLFSEEDSCDLKLVNPDNPLESAIEIMAKPKGKRPLTINQLSGGEKTLTATSLLFAIYLLKPAPFCIFDEVDAPLDDANIDKFNHIVRKFSDDSQFIIVTHNKRTMAATDIIYGITQTEGDIGVSKVVPVDLRELSES